MASPEIENLAQRLVSFETAHDNASDARGDVALRVIEELRLRLIRLAGVEGFRFLLSRALRLATSEAPLLNLVHVGADGSLEGFDGIQQGQEAGAIGQAGILLLAHLLELLVIFIGKPLTLSLVREAWPEASLSGADWRTEEKL